MALNLCPWATVCCKPSVGQALMMRVTLLSLLEKPSKHVATDQGVWYMPRRPGAPTPQRSGQVDPTGFPEPRGNPRLEQ